VCCSNAYPFSWAHWFGTGQMGDAATAFSHLKTEGFNATI